MKRGLIIVAVLLAATFGAHFFMDDPGYALINFRGVALETSVLGLGLFAVLAYVAVRLVIRSLRSVSDLGRAAGRYQTNQARKKLSQGLIEAAEGNHSRAEKLLAQSAVKSESPVLNYLGAARAAQAQKAPDRRDNWLMKAYESDAKSARAVLLTQAELQANDGDYERALATLRKLEEQSPVHPQGLALLANIYQQLGDWEQLTELLPQLKKRKALPKAQIQSLAEQAWGKRLEYNGASGDTIQLQRQWQAVPKKLKQQPVLFRDYVSALNRSGEHALAEQAIRKSIKKSWDSALLEIYSQLEGLDAAVLHGHVASWLKSRPEDPALLVAAARLALRAEKNDQALSYIETAVKIDPTPDAYQVQGAVLLALGQADEAAVAFRQGLAMATGRIESTLPVISTADIEPAADEAQLPDSSDGAK